MLNRTNCVRLVLATGPSAVWGPPGGLPCCPWGQCLVVVHVSLSEWGGQDTAEAVRSFSQRPSALYPSQDWGGREAAESFQPVSEHCMRNARGGYVGRKIGKELWDGGEGQHLCFLGRYLKAWKGGHVKHTSPGWKASDFPCPAK
jgi:hypothetical protein